MKTSLAAIAAAVFSTATAVTTSPVIDGIVFQHDIKTITACAGTSYSNNDSVVALSTGYFDPELCGEEVAIIAGDRAVFATVGGSYALDERYVLPVLLTFSCCAILAFTVRVREQAGKYK